MNMTHPLVLEQLRNGEAKLKSIRCIMSYNRKAYIKEEEEERKKNL